MRGNDKSIILGIDPGLQRTGWGVISTQGSSLKFVACGVIKTNASHPLDVRLKSIHDGIRKVADMYSPIEAAIEETFVSVNGASTLKLGQARGAAMLSLSLCSLPVSEYSATSVKKAVVGNGHAEKKQVEAMMKILLPGANPEMADAADALAIAVCHANSRLVPKAAAYR